MAIGEDLDLALRIRALVEGQDAIVNLGTSFVDLNKRIELLTRGLTGVFGSAEAASKEFDYLAEVADKYGLQLLDLSESYLKLSAAAKDTNLEGEAAKKIFESVSGALAVMGGTTEMTERAFTSLTQMMSKGQIYSEELKGQLAENLPGAIQTLSNALGIGTQDLLRMMEAGNVTSDVLLPFAYELDKQYGKLATSSDTFAQAMNRLKNSWLEVMKGLGDTGIWKALTLTIGALGDNVSVVAGLLGGVFGVAIQKSVIGIANLSSAITENIKSLVNQKAAVQEAAAVARKAADDELAAAIQSAEAAAKRAAQAEIQLRESNLLVAANEREVQSLIAKNAVIDTATQAINKATLADQQLLQAQGRLVAAEEALNAVWASTTAVQNEANLASAERYRLALLATAQNERDLAAGTATLLQAERNLDSINETIAAKYAEQAATEEIQELEERRYVLQERYLAAEKNMEVVRSKKVALAGDLIVAEAELLVSGDKELAQLTKTASARADDVAKAEAQVAAKQALATAALRNAEGTLAEGGSVQKAADATERLSIAQEKNVLIQKEATKATTANAAAQAELAAATQRAALAGTESAAKVGLLARAWGLLTGPAGMIALVVAGFATMLFSFREQSEATKTLAKDTEDYTKTLEGMNAAKLASVVKASREEISEKEKLIATYQREIQLLDQHSNLVLRAVNGWYSWKNVLQFWVSDEEKRRQAVLDSNQANEELLKLQGKQAVGLNELKERYDGLGSSVERARTAVSNTTSAYEQQKNKVSDLQKQLALSLINNEDSISIHKELTKAVEDLQVANRKREVSENSLTTIIKERGDAEQAYAEFTGLSRQAVQALATSNYEYINSLDAKSQAIVKNIQDMDRLQKLEKELQAELKASKAEYEALTTVTKAKVDQMDKEAKAFGDLNTQRQMAIEKSKLEVQAAEQAAVIANRELVLLQTQLAEKNKLLAINDKNAEQINKEIGEVEALIIKKRAEVVARNAAVGAAEAEAEAARNAVTLMKDSYEIQKSALEAAKVELANLQAEYVKLIQLGATDSQLELMLKRIAAKEAEIAELADRMGGKLQQAARDIGQDWDELTTGMDFAFQKMIDSLELLAEKGVLTGEQLLESIGKAISTADTQQELDALAEKLNRLADAGKLSGIEVTEWLAKIRQRATEVANDGSYDIIVAKMRQISAAAIETLTIEERVLLAKQNELKASLELARAKGDEYGARKAIVEMAQTEALLAELNAAKKQIELQAAIAILKNVQDEIEAKIRLGEVITDIDRIKQQEATNAMKVAAIELEAAGKIEEAEKKKALAIQLSSIRTGEQVSVANQHSEALHREAGFVEQITESMRESAEAAKEAAAAQKAAKEEAEHLAARGAFISSIINGWTQRLEELSPAARKAFDGFSASIKTSSMDLNQLNDKMEENSRRLAEISSNATSADMGLDSFYTGIAAWAAKLGAKALTIEQSFLSQKAAFKTATDALDEYIESGKMTTDVQQAMMLAAGRARQEFNLLDRQDLDNLTAKLEEANNKLREMQQETVDARQQLAEMNAELLEAQGADQKAELLRQQINYQERLAELEQKIAEAQRTGNQELLSLLYQQKDVLEQINQAKLDSIQKNKSELADSDKAVNAANKVKDAWSGAAGQIERAGVAMSQVNATDLSKINNQMTSLGQAARTLAGAL